MSYKVLMRDKMKVNRQILEKIEDDGRCYNVKLANGKMGTVWVDISRKQFYELESENEDLLSDDLSDEEIENIMVVKIE